MLHFPLWHPVLWWASLQVGHCYMTVGAELHTSLMLDKCPHSQRHSLRAHSASEMPASWPGNTGPSWALWGTGGISAPHTYPVLSPLNGEPLARSKEVKASRLQIEMTCHAFFGDTSPTSWFLLEKHRLFSILKDLQHVERSMAALSEGKLHLELAPI